MLAALVGFLIAAASGGLGVAGGEMRIPALMYLFAVPVKDAGTISLLASIPTVAAGAFTYRKLGHIPNRVVVLSLLVGAGSVVGVLVGASLLPLVDKHTLKALLGVILLVATLCLTLPGLFNWRNGRLLVIASFQGTESAKRMIRRFGSGQHPIDFAEFILERHARVQQIGDRHPVRMRRQPRRQPGILQPPLDQIADVFRRQGTAGQLLRLPDCRAEQRSILVLRRDARHFQIGQDVPLQFEPHRDFPRLAALLLEPQDVDEVIVPHALIRPQVRVRFNQELNSDSPRASAVRPGCEFCSRPVPSRGGIHSRPCRAISVRGTQTADSDDVGSGETGAPLAGL